MQTKGLDKNLLRKLGQWAETCPETGSRSKLALFLLALEKNNILEACQESGVASSYYYYWWNRFRDSGFKLQSLREKSRRPKKSPRQIAPQVVVEIVAYRKLHHSPEKIKFFLEQEKNIRVSKATIYRVLHREKIPVRQTAARAPRTGLAWAGDLAEKIHSLWKASAGKLKPQDLQSLLLSNLQPRAVPSLSLLPKSGQATVSPPPSLLANRYRVEQELGRGGAGVVYQVADQRARGKKVALKLLPVEHRRQPALIKSLKNEFASLSALHHSNLTRVYDFGLTEHEIYFTSEWIEGRDILQAAAQADLNTTFQLIVQILQALEYLHGRGVLHLDLKPNNILVTDPDRTGSLLVKLIDFGSADWRKRGPGMASEFVGTPPYAAPERIQERAPTSASDIYSLGMIMYQIFAHRFPFQNQEPFAMMKEQVYGGALRISDLHPALPDDFSKVLEKMVAKDPCDRFQTPREVLTAINQSLGENFSLRPANAPVHLLEESDHLFRQDLLAKYLEIFRQGAPQVTVFSGPPGAGKTRLARQLKWALQTRGVHPLWIEDASSLKDFLDGASDSAPLFLDLPETETSDLVALLDRLQNLKVPVLLTTRLPKALDFNPSHWVELGPLNSKDVRHFLEKEIADFPPRPYGEELSELCGGSAVRFEGLLRELREEGLLQWTDRGWCWMAGTEAELRRLPERAEVRWQERLRQVREILSHFSGGLSAQNLEGILGVESGALGEKLNEWVQLGEISQRKTKRRNFYISKTPGWSTPLISPVRDWPWLEQALEAFYQKGEFAAGGQWAHLLLREYSTLDLSPRIQLQCARHLVATGEGKKALQILPSSAPIAGGLAGLFYEIRARAEAALGKAAQASIELQNGERAYRQAGDKAGLSRIFNLQGTFHKMAGDLAAAEQDFLESIRWAQQCGDKYHEGLARMNLATLYHDRGEFSRAREVYEVAFALDAVVKQPLLSCKLRHNWVNLLFLTGQAGEAETVCYEWLKLSLSHRYPDQQAAALNYLALLAGQKNHRELQMGYYNEALGLLSGHSFPQLYFQTLLNRAYLHWDLRKFTAAQLDGEAARDLARQHLGPGFTCLAQLLLGKVQRDRPVPDLAAASACLNTAHELAWKQGLKQTLWEIDLERGLLAKKKNERERAQNYLLSAKKQLESLLAELPEATRQGLLRDRKLERISRELEQL